MRKELAMEILAKLNELMRGSAPADVAFISYSQDRSRPGLAAVEPIVGRFTPGHCIVILNVLVEHMLENHDDTCVCDGCDMALGALREVHKLMEGRLAHLQNANKLN